MKQEIRYQISDRYTWLTCKKASTSGMRPGWLHYSLSDGTIGVAAPGRWREKPKVFDLTPFEVPSGNSKKIVLYVFKSRSEAQFDAVRTIVTDKDFDFTCHPNNPFDSDVTYKGPFTFMFFTKQRHQLCAARILVNGKIELTTSKESATFC